MPQGNSLSVVSCPDSNTCYAVGSGVVTVSHDAGQTWTWTFERWFGTMVALSCPGSIICYAISNSGATEAILGTKDGGATWTQLRPPESVLLNAISCPSRMVCYASGKYAGKVLRTTDGGRTWSTSSVNFRPVDLSCPTVTVCYAPIDTSLIHSPPPSVAVSTDGAKTWTLYGVGLQAQLWNVKCLSESSCYVIAFGGTYGDTPLFLTTNNGGRAWKQHAFPTDTYFRGGSLTCPTATICYLAGDNGTPSGILLATANGGASWVRRKPLTSLAGGLACTAPLRCIAVGVAGNVERTSNGWVTWAEETRNVARTTAGFQQANSLHAISCPSRTVCYAAGDRSSFITTVDGGRHWYGRSGGLARQHIVTDFSTLACPTTTTCFAGFVAEYPPGSGAQVFVTRNAGKTWSANPGKGFAVVTCPSVNVCYAGGEKGAVRISRDGGRTWTNQRTPLAGKQYTTLHLTCPTTSVCYAGAIGPSEPPPHPLSNVGALLSTADGGKTWKRANTDPYPVALACPTQIACFALLTMTYNAKNLVTHDRGRTWSSYSALPSTQWFSITCPDHNTCYASGAEGDVVLTHDGGATWMTESTPTLGSPYGTGCISRESCFVVGGGGMVLRRG